MRLERAVGLANVVETPTLSAAESHLHALLDESLLDPVHLARTDAQDLGNGLPVHPVVVEFAFVAVEQNQCIDHLPRLMRALARDLRERVPLLLLQGHYVTLHADPLVAVGRRGSYHGVCDISCVT